MLLPVITKLWIFMIPISIIISCYTSRNHFLEDLKQHIYHWIGWSLVQQMACHLVGAKSLVKSWWFVVNRTLIISTNLSEILIKISFNRMHFNMLSAKYKPFSLDVNYMSPSWSPQMLHVSDEHIEAEKKNGRHFTDNIFKCISLNENIWTSRKILPKFVHKVPISNIPALVRVKAWHWAGDTPLSEPMMVDLLIHICVTWPKWVNKHIEAWAKWPRFPRYFSM